MENHKSSIADEPKEKMMGGYKCGLCKKSVKFDVKNIGMQCPYCGSKIFYKERPTVAKRIKSK